MTERFGQLPAVSGETTAHAVATAADSMADESTADESTADYTDELPPARQVTTAGEMAAAREDAGLTQQELADRLRLSSAQIMALEQGNWEHLPGTAFVRGAVRAIARELDIDAQRLLAGIGGYCEPCDLVPQMRPMPAEPVATAGMLSGTGYGTKLAAGQRPVWRRYAWPVAGVVALGAVALSFSPNAAGPSETANAGNSRVVQVPIPGMGNGLIGARNSHIGGGGFTRLGLNVSDSGASGNASSASSGSTGVDGAGAHLMPALGNVVAQRIKTARPAIRPVSTASVAGPIGGHKSVAPVEAVSIARSGATVPGVSGHQPQAGTVDVKPVTAGPTAGANTAPAAAAMTFPVRMPESESVRLSFSRPTWVDIRHKDGEKLLFGTQKASKSVVIRGVVPMQVVIGNPDGVKMQFRGNTVDLHAKSRKGVSRFVLN